jgi:Histidine phosphatase superfamily (branch 1)
VATLDGETALAPGEALLVRHADAGDRRAWSGPDELRPLDRSGRRQAAALAELLAPLAPRRIVSSPAVRCRETVEPLAAALGLPVEESDALAEGAPRDPVRALLAAADRPALSVHGDLFPDLLGGRTCRKAGAVVVRVDGPEVTVVRAIGPP